MLSNGQVPVTLQLLGRAASSEECWSGINHLGRDHIEEYLEKNLHWRIVAVRVILCCLLVCLLLAAQTQEKQNFTWTSTLQKTTSQSIDKLTCDTYLHRCRAS